MHVVQEIKKINQMLKNGSNILYNTKIEVPSYNSVVQKWIHFKTFKGLNLEHDTKLIRDIFKFHRSNLNHIILYYSKNMNTCLLMCRVHAKYINLLIPAYSLHDYNTSIIATYT